MFVALQVQAAEGHGPCNCSFPELGKAGTRVNIRSHAYRVIVNPRREDFTLPPGGLESAYLPKARRTVVLSRPRTQPVRHTSIRIPRSLPAGIYLVLVFDGSEAGQHYTWDYFHVLGAQTDPSNDDDEHLPFLIGVVVGACAAGLTAAVVRMALRR
jgi:hypothetical protein